MIVADVPITDGVRKLSGEGALKIQIYLVAASILMLYGLQPLNTLPAVTSNFE
jgi:hypothetical protein